MKNEQAPSIIIRISIENLFNEKNAVIRNFTSRGAFADPLEDFGCIADKLRMPEGASV
jgi:hypothetical protein